MILTTLLVCSVMIVCIDSMGYYMIAMATVVMSMAYMNMKITLLCGTSTMLLVIGKIAVLITKGKTSAIEAGTTIFILLFILAAVFYVTKLRVLFNKENIEYVEESARKQVETAEKMSHVSEDIVSNFDEADCYIKELSEAINTSNSSMQNIASSIEATTQSIQEQAQRCQDIQSSTQNAKEQTKQATENIGSILNELSFDVESVTTSIGNSVESIEKQNRLIEETKGKFDAIDSGVNELMSIIQGFEQTVGDIACSTDVIADGINGLSASSQEVVAASNEGANLMAGSVDNMNKVNVTLSNIYDLAQELKSE